MKRGLSLVLAFVIAVLFSTGASAQVFRFPTPTPSRTPTPTPSPTPTPEPKQMPCPVVAVQAQPPQIRDGQPVSFMLNLNGGDPRVQPTILWTLTAGTIKTGQNSRRIDVDSTGSGSVPDRELRASVWVGGYAPECLLEAKAAIKVIPAASKIGEVGELASDKFSNMLKVVGNTLAQSPDNLYVFAYAGRKSERGYTFTWLKRIKDELTMAGMDPRRVVAVDGGFREEPAFEYWTVPMGSEPPRPSPTVRRDEIVYPKSAPSQPPPRRPST